MPSQPQAEKPTIPVILGPTASGKTAVGIALAELLNAEIISADSRQIYKELTIGSAKPVPEELNRVRHHFIDELSITNIYDAGRFAKDAAKRIRAIRENGKNVVVVGGSTLYIEGLVKGFADLPKQDPLVREAIEKDIQLLGAEKMYEKLKTLDPVHAKTLDPTKTQRLVRSLEIIELSGKTITELYHEQVAPDEFNYQLFGLDLPRKLLYQRINDRTDKMMAMGFLDEAKVLYNTYGSPSGNMQPMNALCTVGYNELFAYFRGELIQDEAINLIKQHTRNYAKRQLTFFRNRLSVEWMGISSLKESHEEIAQKILQRVQ
jgi:tRNA dimethylallyltransferase